MQVPVRFFAFLLFVSACLGAAAESSTESAKTRSIDEYTCKDVMRETGRNREVAIAFLHGYLLGKSGQQKFDLDTLAKQSDAFVEQCLDSPNQGCRSHDDED